MAGKACLPGAHRYQTFHGVGAGGDLVGVEQPREGNGRLVLHFGAGGEHASSTPRRSAIGSGSATSATSVRPAAGSLDPLTLKSACAAAERTLRSLSPVAAARSVAAERHLGRSARTPRMGRHPRRSLLISSESRQQSRDARGS